VNDTIQLSPEIYRLLKQQAETMQSTPEQVAEAAIRLHLANTVHIEQKQTRFGLQAYIRGTRVAVRHVAAFLKAGHSAEEIINTGLPHLSPAAIYEAIAYYYDHQAEIEAELAANTPEAAGIQLQKLLSPTDYAIVTGRS
jgi:uncharacterized protein (DUF433 family)